jgi:tRNA (guanine-N7-)-methyltransferase
MNDSQAAAWARWCDRYLVDGLPRLSAGMKRAPRHPRDELGELDEQVVAVQLAPQPPLDLVSLFGRDAPLCVEIGCGSGENLAAVAQARPDWDLLGFEVYEKALASTMGRLAKQGSDNARLVCADGVGGLELLLGPGSIAELITYFPDPWHKKRHHKRRLVNPAFAALAASRLAVGGCWRVATDWDDYADAIAEVLAGCPQLADDYAGQPTPRPPARPLTKFEQRGVAAGRTIHEFCWTRVDGGAA